MQMKSYVVLAGNIGAGKSTLVGMICERLGWEPYYEPVAENPYLDDFYKDMRAWAFHSQVFFLTWRAQAHRALMDVPRAVVQDRSFYEDAEVFARALHLQGQSAVVTGTPTRPFTGLSPRSSPRRTSWCTCGRPCRRSRKGLP